MLGAAVEIRADLVSMLCAKMAIARLSGLRGVVALETALRGAAGDRAALDALSTAGADDSSDAAGEAKGHARHIGYSAAGA